MLTTNTEQAKAKSELSPSDKAAIIRSAMEIKLKSEGPSKFSEYLVFSTTDMSSALLPRIPGFAFRMMKPSQIKKRTQSIAGFRYLIVDFAKTGEFISFNLHLVERRGGLPLYSHVYKYRFSRVGGEWQGKLFMIIC